VVSLIDRLVHNAEIIAIEGESYRLREAKERAQARQRKRTAERTPKVRIPAHGEQPFRFNVNTCSGRT
jgi:DNA replication protein DnaC